MSNPTSNFGWQMPTPTDLVTDLPADFEVFGQAVDSTLADLKGGTSGQILSKNSNTDMDFVWTTPNPGDITGVTAGTGISGGGTSGDVTITNSMATAIDAKGDLIAGTGADAFSRLAAGNNGEALLADSSTSTGLRYSPAPAIGNPVLNSALQCWQRGTSFTGASLIYTADRWIFSGSTAQTITRQATGDTTNLPNIQYGIRVQRNSGSTSTLGHSCGQIFETVNSIPYAGKTVTLSFYAKVGANYSTASSAIEVNLATGTGTDQNLFTGFTGRSNVILQNQPITTTYARYSFTATLSSTMTQIALNFTATPTGTAGANDWFEITGVQLDMGSVALPFRTYSPTIQGELAACQRYYYRNGGDQTTQPYAIGYGTSSTTALMTVTHPVPMRIAPSLTDYALLWVVDHATTTNVTSMGVPGNWSGKNCTAVNAVVASGLTTNRPYNLIAQGTLSSYLGFSAEL